MLCVAVLVKADLEILQTPLSNVSVLTVRPDYKFKARAIRVPLAEMARHRTTPFGAELAGWITHLGKATDNGSLVRSAGQADLEIHRPLAG